MPSLQYLHLSSGTGGMSFTIRPYFLLGMLLSATLERFRTR